MTRERAGSAAWIVAGVLVAVLTASCGADPSPKGDPTKAGASTAAGGSTSPSTPESTFPPDAPLANGPWIPSPTLRIKVPTGFKGDGVFGVTTLTKGPLTIAITDYSSLGTDDIDSFAEEEKRSIFDGKATYQTGEATVDGQAVETFHMTGKTSILHRVSYGFLLTDADGGVDTVVVAFMATVDPEGKYRDTIDSVLASIRWSKDVVG